MCLAPLTNIAIAVSLDPSIAEKVKRVFIMGGTLYGKGNVKGGQEFNFKTDPEAAHIVFKKFPLIHLVPWEAARDLNLTAEDYEKLYDKSYPITEFTGNIAKFRMEKFGRISFCDGLAAVAAVDLSLA